MNFLKCIWPFKKTDSKVESKTEQTVSKKALCVGINDYPGTSNDLNGCVNDAKEWASLLKSKYGFGEIAVLLNSSATAANVKQKLEAMILGSKPRDILVFTYSGHGTTVFDSDGDETDRYDEAICCFDSIVKDDELRAIISKTPKGVKLTIISDSCHSGTITRAFLVQKAMNKTAGRPSPIPRYMPPADRISIKSSKREKEAKKFLSQEQMVETLLTGCKNTEYSYDATINGKPMGAMSANAINILKSNPSLTWDRFFAELRKKLPSTRFPQTPQLEATSENKKKVVFS